MSRRSRRRLRSSILRRTRETLRDGGMKEKSMGTGIMQYIQESPEFVISGP